MANTKASAELKAKLEQAEDTLNRLKLRYYLLRAFQDELDAVVGRKRFDILNDHIWTMVFDTRDALALHLTSWSKGMAGQGGLFGQLNANTGALYVPRPKTTRGSDLSSLVAVSRRKAFETLFPDAIARNKVVSADVKKLTDRFLGILTRVRNDRSRTLAHMYERDAQLSRRLLTPRGYAPVFTRLEKLLNQIRLVVDNSTRDFSDLSWADTEAVAKDLVDMCVCGTISHVLDDFEIAIGNGETRYYWQFRQRRRVASKKRRTHASRRPRAGRAG